MFFKQPVPLFIKSWLFLFKGMLLFSKYPFTELYTFKLHQIHLYLFWLYEQKNNEHVQSSNS